MATFLKHIKLQFGGTIGTTSTEIWSCTVRFKGNTDDSASVPSVDFSPEQLDTALGLLNAPLQAWMNASDSQLSSNAKLAWAKLNQIEANGKQRDVNTHRIDTGIVSGSTTRYVPWYQTQALTMRTNISRGRGHSGRIYPPLTLAQPEGGSPYIAEADANRMATSWAAALNGIADAIQTARGVSDATPVYPVIGSPVPTRVGDTGGALLMRVTGVVVDRVPDVQHRRTNAVPRLEGTRANVTGSTP